MAKISIPSDAQKKFKIVADDPRVAKFEDYILNHQNLEAAFERLLHLILHPPSKSLIIFLIGATAVGKTTLLNRMVAKIVTMIEEQKLQDTSRVFQPIMELPAYDRFSTVDFYKLALEALHEPLIGQKIGYEKVIKTAPDGSLIIANNAVKADLRKCLIKAHEHRKPLFFGIDESSNFMNVAGVNSLQVIANLIRSLANLTKTPHLLSGTHELLPMLKISAQNTRRTRIVLLDRYRLDKNRATSSMSEFRSILKGLSPELGLKEMPMLIDNADYFYQYSLGCVGILKEWLLEALTTTISSENETAENFLNICESTRRSPSELNQMLIQIQSGEHDLDLIEEEKINEQLRANLGMPPKVLEKGARKPEPKNEKSSKEVAANIRFDNKTKHVFRRIRVRDKTGFPHERD